MKLLLSPEGQIALRHLLHERALLAFDFDGTLAPIVWRPADARITIGVRRRLARLALRAPVAVISGRSAADVRERIPPEIRHCIGNHGNEGLPGPVENERMPAICGGWIAQLSDRLAADAPGSGIVIEDKGLTISLHFRHARDRGAAADWLLHRIGELEPSPRLIRGKLVFNLLPPGARTKYEALCELAGSEGVERILFVGDDETDELVFAQAPASWLTIKVDLDSASKAQYFLQRQSEVAILLDQLLSVLDPAGQAPLPGGDSMQATTPAS